MDIWIFGVRLIIPKKQMQHSHFESPMLTVTPDHSFTRINDYFRKYKLNYSLTNFFSNSLFSLHKTLSETWNIRYQHSDAACWSPVLR